MFGEGSLAAKLMIVGEAPGANEDAMGLPFYGASGRLLRQYIQRADFITGEVFLTNAVRCRPPKKRDPTIREMIQCSDHLAETIRLINPMAILAVGVIASRALSDNSMTMSQFRQESGKLMYEGVEGLEIPLFFTYHPAYILRNSSVGPLLQGDLTRVRRFIRGQGTTQPTKPREARREDG